ncbi:unnamed protein product, partial [Brassica oleracea var. botrytis]
VGEEFPSSHDKTWINDQQVSSIGDLNMFLSNTTDQVPKNIPTQFSISSPLKKSYFICKARIVEVLTQNGWYYVSCSRCNKKLENSAASLRCRQYVISNVTGIVSNVIVHYSYCVE